MILLLSQYLVAYDPYETHLFDNSYEKYYPPYPSGKAPRTCKINRMNLKHIQEGIGSVNKYVYEFSEYGQRKFVVIVKKKGSTLFRANIIDGKSKKKIISDVVVYDSHWGNSAIVFWSYLNKDNKKDLILAFPLSSSSSDTYILTFLLSNKKGYSAIEMHTLGISQSLFYDYNDDGKCEFLQFDSMSDYALMRKFHLPITSYLIYNIVQFDASSFKYNNALSRFFPRWLEFKSVSVSDAVALKDSFDQYGHVPNDKAVQLPKVIKEKIWSIYLKKRKP